MRSVSFLMVPSHKRILLLVYFSSSTPFGTKCVLILLSVSPPLGGFFHLFSSALQPHLEQSAFRFFSQDPFPQQDCLTCLVHPFRTIWNKVRSVSFLVAPSHRRMLLLVYFGSSTQFEIKSPSDSSLGVTSNTRIDSLV